MNQTPEIGMGATKLLHSDRHAYTIIAVLNPKTIVVQADTATRTDNNGISESQTYEYTPDPIGRTYTLTLRKNGRWIVKGESATNGQAFSIGERREYYDYSF